MVQRIHPGWLTPPWPRPETDFGRPPTDGPSTKLVDGMTPTQRWCWVEDTASLTLGRAWIGREPVLITELYGSKVTVVRTERLAVRHFKGTRVISAERTED